MLFRAPCSLLRLPPSRYLVPLVATFSLLALLFRPTQSVQAETYSFSNPAAITISSTGNNSCTSPTPVVAQASPYPSEITVSGVSGNITGVTVTLANVTHTFTADVDVLLVGPGGQNLILMSDVAGSGDVNGTLTFTDTGSPLPGSVTNLDTGTYRPTNLNSVSGCARDVFPAPAPTASANTTLAGAFNGLNGSNVNGAWRLFVVDDTLDDDGSIGGGWSLNITTAPPLPTISLPSPQPSTSEDTDLPIYGITSGFTVVDPDAMGFVACDVSNAVNGLFAYTAPNEQTGSSIGVFGPTYSGVVNDFGGYNIRFRPTPNYNGPASFQITCGDYNGTTGAIVPGTTSTVTYNLTVNPVNDAPVVDESTRTTNEDTALTITVGSDVDDTVFSSSTIITPPANGSVGGIDLAARTVVYTPNTNFNGSDGFSVQVCDAGGLCDTGTINITATPVNDAPVAIFDSYSATEDTLLTITASNGVLANDSDPDGDTLTAVLDLSTLSGSLALNPNGSFSYTPNPNFTGTDSFTYRARDPGFASSSVTTVTIGVAGTDDLPVITLPSPEPTTPEDTDLPLFGATSGFTASDPDAGAEVTCVLTNVAFGSFVRNSLGITEVFTIVVTGSNYADVLNTLESDNIRFRPTSNYYGSATFFIQCGDSAGGLFVGATSRVTYTLQITPVNDLPVITLPSPQPTTSEDTDLPLFGATSGFTVSDIDAAARIRCLIDNAVNGQFVFESLGDVPAISINTETSSYADYLSELDGSNTRFRPAPDFTGTASFNITCGDADGLGFAAGTTVSATYTLVVGAVNDAPVASNDSYSTGEDTPLTISAPGVLANDSDSDGDTLTAVLDLSTLSGSLTLNPDGSFTYTPNPNFTGTDSFTYRARDPGFASSNFVSVAISVGGTNDAPVANNDNYTVNQGNVLTVPSPGVLANDTDAEGDALIAALEITTNNGLLNLNGDGSFTYTPNTGFSGTDTFMYDARDTALRGGNFAIVTINVVANAPTHTPTGTPRPSATPGMFPTPPETPLCVQRNPIANDIVRAGGNDEFNDDIYCRTLVQNRNYVFYFTNPLTSAANVGDLGVLALGVQQAVDVFSPNATYWTNGFVVCLRGSGTMIYMRASGAPRVAEVVGTYTIADWPGFTCVTIFEPGTLVLANRQ